MVSEVDSRAAEATLKARLVLCNALKFDVKNIDGRWCLSLPPLTASAVQAAAALRSCMSSKVAIDPSADFGSKGMVCLTDAGDRDRRALAAGLIAAVCNKAEATGRLRASLSAPSTAPLSSKGPTAEGPAELRCELSTSGSLANECTPPQIMVPDSPEFRAAELLRRLCDERALLLSSSGRARADRAPSGGTGNAPASALISTELSLVVSAQAHVELFFSA